MKDTNDKELLISEKEIYELAITNKQHNEDRRDQINTYYISLFAGIIAIIPFIDQVAKAALSSYEGHIVKGSLTILSLIGLILAVTWALNLKRTLSYLEEIDEIIAKLEKKYNQGFITTIQSRLKQKGAPGRITKYQIVIPYTFISIFLCIIIYSILWIFYASN